MSTDDRKTVFSPDRRYRYTLWRKWPAASTGYVMFIGLNPSTADEYHDDPTIRRCVGFAQLWGFGALCMVNLFAFRATNPRVMMGEPSPIGNENDRWITAMAREASLVVAAWGTRGRFMARDEEVVKLLDGMDCLGTTSDGSPRHPLYLRADTPLVSFPNDHNQQGGQ